MRIRYKVALVGGIPITIAAAIAVAAWLLLVEAEKAREGAVLAGAAYRDLVEVLTARNDYVAALPHDRQDQEIRFYWAADKAGANLNALAAATGDPMTRSVAVETRAKLGLANDQMRSLVATTERNDSLVAEMGARAGSLIDLTDRARARQHASNADIISSLTESDRKLRLARDIVDHAQELRAAFLAIEVQRARPGGSAAAATPESVRQLQFALVRLRNSAADLAQLLIRDGRNAENAELKEFMQRYERDRAPPDAGPSDAAAQIALTDGFGSWLDRLIKVNSTEQRAMHDEVAQLLTYSVSAAETEQATQNVAIAALKLGRGTADALESRNVGAITELLATSQTLASTMQALPISPLIQSEMIDAIDGWRDRLATTREGLGRQNLLIYDMSRTANAMIQGAGKLNDLLTGHADKIGQFVRTILVLGAAVGLLLGSGTAYVVARSITQPLRQLRDDMIRLANDPGAGLIKAPKGRDELGAMARAVNFFLTEIAQRERALRRAKDRTDSTLRELRETQANLIQAEKLASLGQLVAGVSHEINTPIGVALTTSTALENEVRRLGASVDSGRLLKSELTHLVGRLTEGSRLLFTNLTRAVDLVQSFKQVAADQASGERRQFAMKGWLHDLLTSLGPVLRKRGHEVIDDCPDDIVLDSYPGALAQVLTNLVMNAVIHAYPDGRAGRMEVQVLQIKGETVRIVFSDDGKGIAPEHLGKVFDPFFTTGRDQGNTGLGLHIVYNIVTAKLHGTIELDSTLGQGTRFTIDLPVSIVEASPELALLSA